MADIRNLQILKTFTDFFKLKAFDSFGSKVGEIVVPVVNVSIPPANIQTAVTNRVSTGTQAMLTTRVDKRTFLTGAFIQYQHDVSADSVLTTFNLTALGKSAANLIRLVKITLTATQDSVFVPLNPPVELERGTPVSVTQTFSVGAGTIAGAATFYELDD